MVDIHSHMLPGVDDGSDGMNESLEMARIAVSGGTEEMVITPHCNIPYMYKNYAGSKITDCFNELKLQISNCGIPLEIYLGAEVFITDEITGLIRTGRVNTINNGRYILVEFGFNEEPEYMYKMLHKIISEGIVPVVAHPERYYAVFYYPEIIYGWIEAGAVIQINKGSLLGRFGKEPEAVARVLLAHNLVHCIASDAHTSWRRTPYLADAMDVMTDLFSQDYARNVLEINPHKIIFNSKPELYGEPGFPDVDIRRLL